MVDVTRSRVGGTTLLVPHVALNLPDRIDGLEEALRTCLAERDLHVALDLSAVSVVTSRALEVLLDAQDELAGLGGGLSVTGANAVVRDALALTGLSAQIANADPEAQEAVTRAVVRAPSETGRIGELLVGRGLVSDEQVSEALGLQEETGERMALIMVDKGWLEEQELFEVLSDQLGLPLVSLRSGLYDPAVVRLVKPEVLRRLAVLPLFRVRDVIHLATCDPQSLPTLETVSDLTGCAVAPVLATRPGIQVCLADALADGNDLSEYLGDLETDLELVETQVAQSAEVIDELAGASPVINLINGLIQRAVQERASDIHIEPQRKRTRVRLRVDGVLHTIMAPPQDIHPALVSRLKVMSSLDIAERRLPQDGRLQVVTAGRAVDLRFSSLPGMYGEKVVLRVLDKSESVLEIDRLGMHETNVEAYRGFLRRSHGLVLVTGPTGSGKTTTLYAALNGLNDDERNLITIEDPVEYQIDGITQNQVREAIDLGFARMLKHILRQDPDVIMVGEIREKETAEIAVQAALTGHLVLSTLHTNDSVGAITRLLDMGIEPFLLSSALAAIIAQRLIRRVCPECRTVYAAPAESLAPYGYEAEGELRLVRGRGCDACFSSGYRGRLAIHEVVASDSALQRLIVSNPTREDLQAHLREGGVRTLLEDGLERALGGETTVEEVLRVAAGGGEYAD
jgi:type IV pilus assembly protein PilB